MGETTAADALKAASDLAIPLVGVLLLAVILNGFVLLNLSVYWQGVVSGLILVVAIAVDAVRRRRNEAQAVAETCNREGRPGFAGFPVRVRISSKKRNSPPVPEPEACTQDP